MNAFAMINILPDSWQNGPIPEIITIGAVLTALTAIWRFLITPSWNAVQRLSQGIDTLIERIGSIPEHENRLDAIEGNIAAIQNALAPTNGDRRSISDRLDTVKYQTTQNTDMINVLCKRLDSKFGGMTNE